MGMLRGVTTLAANVLSEIASRVHAAERIALVAHADPDADAIGSTLGLALALQALGKRVIALCDDPVPSDVRFLPARRLVKTHVPRTFQPDLLIALDSSDTLRLGKAAAPLLARGLPVINIDHHVTNLQFGTLNLVEPERASTAELLLDVIDALGVTITAEIATCLLSGIVGDTRSFSTSNTTPRTLASAARLTASGADIAFVTEQVLNTSSVDTLALWGLALSNLKLDGGLIWCTIPFAQRQEIAMGNGPKRGISSLLLQAREAQISAVFTELPDGRVEISMRARPGYDVAALALALGGGGHPQASGCTVEGPLEDAVARVVGALKEQAETSGARQG